MVVAKIPRLFTAEFPKVWSNISIATRKLKAHPLHLLALVQLANFKIHEDINGSVTIIKSSFE